MSDLSMFHRSAAIATRIEPALQALDPVMHGAVLSHLVAAFLASYRGEGDRVVRDLMQTHLDLVMCMVEAPAEEYPGRAS